MRGVGWILPLAALLTAVLGCTSSEPPVVFTSDRDGNLEIYAVRVSDGTETNLTESAADEFAPRVSPDRKMVAFLAGSPVSVTVDVSTVTGESRRSITSPGVRRGHRWSHDSSRLAYVAEEEGRESVYFNGVDDSRQMSLTSIDSQEVGGWSPRGAAISFTVADGPGMGIYVRNPDGVNEFRLTDTPDSAPVWSPDGKRLAFISTRDGTPEIYLMNEDGTGEKRLTNNDAPEDALSWSPNNRTLVFVSGEDGNAEIYVMDAGSGSTARLTHNTVRDDQPVWSPNGKSIAFVSYLDGDAEIFVMSADGSNQQRLTSNDAEDTAPSW